VTVAGFPFSMPTAIRLLGATALCALLPLHAWAQDKPALVALRGLAPVASLPHSQAGRAALSANYTVTGGIQRGTLQQPTLLPLPDQRQQALRDIFITGGNLAELTDGFGSTLGDAYQARAHYIDRTHFTAISPAASAVIAYAESASETDSRAAKFFFANATTDGHTPVSPEAGAILKDAGGVTDVFGRAYHHEAGTSGNDAYGNSRPFQTEPTTAVISGPDYLGVRTDNLAYANGPYMMLVNSPSYPSGHTSYGYTGALVLAMLVPDRYPELVVRAAEYGNSRIIAGAHYAMDVLGGRTLALYSMAHLLANDPAYVGRSFNHAPMITDFRAAVTKARADVTNVLQANCGDTLAACATQDRGRFNQPEFDAAFIAATQTYGLPVVFPAQAGRTEDVGKLAPEAGYLLTVAYPTLSLDKADRILTETESPGGGFLDNGSGFGVYSRLDLYAAARRAAGSNAMPGAASDRAH